MRSSLDELLLALEKARTDTVEGGARPAAATGPPRRLPAARLSKEPLLERLRAKAQAAPVRDMLSMLNRHKENVVVN